MQALNSPMSSGARRFLGIAAVSVAIATALGAFGTHALTPRLTPDRLKSFETGVTYQFFHSLGLFGIALLMRDLTSKLLTTAAWVVVIGLVLFCGSIYLLTFGAPRAVIALAPVGGSLLMLAWVLVAVVIFRNR
ncbi:MAG: DUF423 domain-containing protein [Pseudomonadales bacterium]|nr:DUF423 domain-containing protein [Pseudomonadales bacterium]